MVGGLRDLQGFTDVDDGLAMGDQLLSGLALADDLLRCVAGSFHGGAPGPVWPDQDSHPPWTDSQGPHNVSDGALRTTRSGWAIRSSVRTRTDAPIGPVSPCSPS